MDHCSVWVYHAYLLVLCDCVQIAQFFIIGWMQDVREALNSYLLERSIVFWNTVHPAPEFWEHFKHCSFIMIITNDWNPHGEQRQPMIVILIPLMWSWWSERNRLDCPSSRVFLRELQFWTNKQQCWKNIQGGIYCCLSRLMWFPQMIWFTSLGLDVFCLQHIKDVCNTCRKPFVGIPIHLKGSRSAGVGSTWFEICHLHSWETQKCSCASWTSQAGWKCKLITVKRCLYKNIRMAPTISIFKTHLLSWAFN